MTIGGMERSNVCILFFLAFDLNPKGQLLGSVVLSINT